MIIHVKITNDENINIVDIRYWLINNCRTWILKNENTIVNIIFTTIYDRRMDNIINNFKFHIKKYYENCLLISKSKINIFKAKQVNNHDFFCKLLKQQFFENSMEVYDFLNIELKGYTKKTIISMLKKYEIKTENDMVKPSIKEGFVSKTIIEKPDKQIQKTCKYCSKIFPSVYNCNRHVKKCKCNTQNISITTDDSELNKNIKLFESIIDRKFENITNILEGFKNKNSIDDSINNTNTNTNNTNTNNTNYKSKRDKLNENFINGIELDIFIYNYTNDPEFQLTKNESQVLLENSENLGLISFGEGLFTCIKKKYSMLLEKLTGVKHNYYDVVLPFICSDVNLRTHFEFNNKEWNLIKTTDKIKSIISISDQQIFKHHNRFVRYSKRGKNTVVNIFLRKSDFIDVNNMIESKSNKTPSQPTP